MVSNKEYKRRAQKEKRDEELVKNNEYKANEKKESNETEKVSKARQKTGLTPAERKAKSRAAQSAKKRQEELVKNNEYKRQTHKK